MGQHHSIQHLRLVVRDDEDALTREIVALASTYGRYGYRRVAVLLRSRGWHGNYQESMADLAA